MSITQPTLCLILFCLFSFFSSCFSELCNRNDKKVLLQIKKSLNPSFLSSWDSKTDCCANWTGIECSNATTGNRVITLRVSYNGDFNAQIPPQIADLPFLQSLELENNNNLTGPIPYTISNLKNLQSLTIISTKISGFLPYPIIQLKNLQSLTIVSARISGSLPYSFIELKNLESLTIRDTRMSGSIPEFISELKNLKYLDLASNRFTGPVPKTLSLMPKIELINLARNKLTGSLPESFSSFTNGNLHLDLSNNQLSGTIPQSLSKANIRLVILNTNKFRGDASMFFGLNKTTRAVHLWNNEFEFDLSNVKFPRSLTNLYLDHNRIYGKLPEDLTKLPKLEELDVSYNRMCGKIPMGGNLQFLKAALFEHNRCLCGFPLAQKC